MRRPGGVMALAVAVLRRACVVQGLGEVVVSMPLASEGSGLLSYAPDTSWGPRHSAGGGQRSEGLWARGLQGHRPRPPSGHNTLFATEPEGGGALLKVRAVVAVVEGTVGEVVVGGGGVGVHGRGWWWR